MKIWCWKWCLSQMPWYWSNGTCDVLYTSIWRHHSCLEMFDLNTLNIVQLHRSIRTSAGVSHLSVCLSVSRLQRCRVPTTSRSGVSKEHTYHLWLRLQMNHMKHTHVCCGLTVSIQNTWQINAGHQRNKTENHPKQICSLSSLKNVCMWIFSFH